MLWGYSGIMFSEKMKEVTCLELQHFIIFSNVIQ